MPTEYIWWIVTAIASLCSAYWVSGSVENYLKNLLGIPKDREGGLSTLAKDEEVNLWYMLQHTSVWASLTSFVLSVAAYAATTNFPLSLIISLVAPLVCWYLATSKAYPKIQGIDFGPRFAEAMQGKFITLQR